MDKIKASQFADLAYYCRENPFKNYRLVEYLEGTGTQYIDTGIIPANTDTVASGFQFTNITISDNTLFYIDNGQAGSNAYGFSIANTSTSGQYVYVCGWGNNYARVSGVDTAKHTMSLCNGVFTVDNNTISTSSSSSTSPNVTRSIKLFGWNRNSTVIIKGLVRVFSFTMKSSSNTTLINLVPCVRKSDSKPGMLDTVTKTFFTNSGTGEFAVGNNV